MPLYCEECDEFFYYGDFRGKPKICPICGSKLEYYENKYDAPRGLRCCDCSLIHTSACPITYWSPEAPFYAKPCSKFKPKT